MHGARAARQSVLERHRGKDIAIFVVWVPMVESDDEAAAREMAKLFADDPRVLQLWDPERKIGAAYRDAHSPASETTEWDIYLWYAKEARWADPAPAPVELLRQFDWVGDGKSVLARGSTTAQRYEASLPDEMAKASDRVLSGP